MKPGDEFDLQARLREWSAQDCSREAPVKLRAAVMAEFDARHRPAAVRWPWWLAAAAMLAAAVVGAAMWPRWTQPEERMTVSWKTPVPPAFAYKPAPKPVAPVRRVVVQTEEVTEFVALAPPTPEGIDSDRLVRVMVSRRELTPFGFPAPADRMGDLMQADLMLGQDGTARAIRFVRPVSFR